MKFKNLMNKTPWRNCCQIHFPSSLAMFCVSISFQNMSARYFDDYIIILSLREEIVYKYTGYGHSVTCSQKNGNVITVYPEKYTVLGSENGARNKENSFSDSSEM